MFAVGLGAAFLLAVGFVLQQHEAARETADMRLHLRILTDLARRPVWLAGIATMVAGQILGAAALAVGELTLVEPLLATNVLFALPLAAVWWRRRPGRTEMLGAVILVAGLATFVAAANPGDAQASAVAWPGWLAAALPIAGVAAVAVVVGQRVAANLEALLLGVGAGALFGLQDALTQRTIGLHPSFAVLASWPPWALVAVAVTGLLLTQSAYQAAPLAASLPATSATEPVTGICLGGGLLSQGLQLSALPLAFEVSGIVAMVLGVAIVARSPLVAAAPRR